MANAVTLKLADGVHRGWTSVEAFRASDIHNYFLQLCDDEGVIDLSMYNFTSGQLTILDEHGDVFVSGDLARIFPAEQVVFSDLMDRYILERYAHYTSSGEAATHNWFTDNEYAQVYEEHYFEHIDNLIWVDEPGCFANPEDTYYDDEHDEHYLEGWEPRDRDRGASSTRITHYGCTRGSEQRIDSSSKLQLGYEIEKNRFTINGEHRRRWGDEVGSFEIFRGFERDGSCGVEAITHILPGDLQFIDKVNGMIDEAADVINSASDSRCGGHINISYKGLTARDIALKMRVGLPFVLSIWRERLNSGYSGGVSNPLVWMHQANSSRHSVFNFKGRVTGKLIEMRLPPRVKDVADLKFRHKLIATWVDITITQDKQDWETVDAALRPIIEEYYGDDAKDRLSMVSAFKEVCDWDPEDVQNRCPDKVAVLIPRVLSRRRRAEVDELIAAERARARRAAQEAVYTGLRSTRRRARTVQIGDSFTVSCMIDGVRRSRTVRVEAQGLSWNRGEILHGINPSEVHGLTIVCGDTTITSWEEYRRAGEVLHYLPRVEARTPQEVVISRRTWERTTFYGDVVRTGWYGRNARFAVCREDDILTSRSVGGSPDNRWGISLRRHLNLQQRDQPLE